MKKFLVTVFTLLIVIGGGLAASLHWVGNKPLPLVDGKPFTVSVKSGASLHSVARNLTERGVIPHPLFFVALVRVLEPDLKLRPGRYKVMPGNAADMPANGKPQGNLRALIAKLASGERDASEITFVEGIRFRDLRKQLGELEDIAGDSQKFAVDELLAKAGVDATFAKHPEGLFFPDTYQFDDGSSDVDLLKRAHATMVQKLNDAWIRRDTKIPLKTPYELLIMASIIEKETGVASERATIASVFYNRMAVNMRLQTDPTVIYGMGESYQGNIRKKDLQTDTPYNTYTRNGLPPTPIAMPGQGSLMAAARPAETGLYYFVGKGDGTHYFSKSLEEHNRAVQKYQLGK